MEMNSEFLIVFSARMKRRGSLEQIFFILCLLSGGVISFSLFGFSVLSFFEKEIRACVRSFLLGVFCLILFAVPVLVLPGMRIPFAVVLVVLFLFSVILLLWPMGRVNHIREEPAMRIDERDIMFSRGKLEQGSTEYDTYYSMRPEHKAGDDSIRSKPGLMSPDASFYSELSAKTADACFQIPENLRSSVDGTVNEEKTSVDPTSFTKFMVQNAKYLGARNVGVCALKPVHIYTHIGRGQGTYGDEILLSHRFAIAFTLEMDAEHVSAGPKMPITMESARQYANAAVISVQLAALIRSLGYPARAHIDGNYRVVAPLIARDAGLGEIGRMGLLMTPDLGPRVRLGIVTTDIPLIVNKPGYSAAMLHFCEICKKCADNCPSRAISSDSRREIDGVHRWQIKQETCYRYWCLIGTDCGKCMAVCPFSHPDNFAHNMVRWAIAHSGFARYLALYMDDFFYGRNPESKSGPSWIL